MTMKDVEKRFKIARPGRVKLRRYRSDWPGKGKSVEPGDIKEDARGFLTENVENLAEEQAKLWASRRHAVLIVLQAMDAAGKDGTIRHVMSGVNPQGCTVTSFKQPSAEERDHTFLWRYTKALPARGSIAIFNRSYYEDVLVVRVHPELLVESANGDVSDRFWERRFRDINAFERHLASNGTLILKFFLNVSKDEQARRLLERLDQPEKNWKFSAGDLAERAHWEDYRDAFEAMLAETSTRWAPWWVIPADNKWVARSLVAAIVTSEIRTLALRMPAVSQRQRAGIAEARRQLRAELNARKRAGDEKKR